MDSNTFRQHVTDHESKDHKVCSTTIHATSPVIQRSNTVYHPIASLMINSNTLRDCYQIRDFHLQCQQNRSMGGGIEEEEPFVCGIAEKYYAMCQNHNNQKA